MPCRPTDALVRGVGSLAQSVIVALIMVHVLTPWGNSGSVAWSETQRITDGAVATAPDLVPVGGKITVEGRNWTAPSGAGSVIAVKLDDGEVDRRTPVINPVTGDLVSESSVVAAVRASADGAFTIGIRVPDDDGWIAGSRHTIRLLTGRLWSEDATRSVALTFDLVSDSEMTRSSTPIPRSPESAGAEPPPTAAPRASSSSSEPRPTTAVPPGTRSGAGAASPAATPSESSRSADTGSRTSPGDREDREARPGSEHLEGASASTCHGDPSVSITSSSSIRNVPVTDLGGVLKVTGSGFCQRRVGGSVISVLIDGGDLKRVDDAVAADRTIWQIIQADADGTFHADVRLPSANQTDPDFADGSHRLTLRTGTLNPNDPMRTVRSGEFVISSGNNSGVLPEPAVTPTPLNPVRALVGERGGAVTAVRSGSVVRVVVPDAEPGDWLFAYAFPATATPGAAAYPTTWLQVDADRSVTFDLTGYTGQAGRANSRVSLQSRDGSIVGWTTVATPDSVVAPANTGRIPAHPSSSAGGSGPRSLVVISASGVLVLGLGALVVAQRRRRWALRDLNDR